MGYTSKQLDRRMVHLQVRKDHTEAMKRALKRRTNAAIDKAISSRKGGVDPCLSFVYYMKDSFLWRRGA